MCASLVHDDHAPVSFIIFADIRPRQARGCPAPYGEPLALSGRGDSRFIHGLRGFLARRRGRRSGPRDPADPHPGESTGRPGGILRRPGAGETEDKIRDLFALSPRKDRRVVHRGHAQGAAAAGEEPDAWTELGARIGEAFPRVADDLRDALYDEATLGKPAHQDEINGRPNAVSSWAWRGRDPAARGYPVGRDLLDPVLPGRGRLVRDGPQDRRAPDRPSFPAHQTGLRRVALADHTDNGQKKKKKPGGHACVTGFMPGRRASCARGGSSTGRARTPFAARVARKDGEACSTLSPGSCTARC